MTDCRRCGRPVLAGAYTRDDRHGDCAVVSYVQYAAYGCDSGCDGHEVVGLDEDGRTVYRQFFFEHPYDDDPETWARSLAGDKLPGAEYDHSRSRVFSDW